MRDKHAVTSYLALIATHLNAPYGQVVRSADIAAALRSGRLDTVQTDPWSKELIATLFAEVSPEIIGRACFEAGGRLEHAQHLYEHVQHAYGQPRVPQWEDALAGVL